MFRTTCFALAASFAGGAIGQAAVRPDPADPKANAPVRPYISAFDGYRPYDDPEIARWRAVNEEMGRLKGHAGHVPASAPAKAGAAIPPKPPVDRRQGDRK
jgi:hypothetical protein